MTFATLIVPFTLASCSDDDDYTPAKEVAEDCPNVYFSSENSNLHIIDLDDEGAGSISLTMKRDNTDEAITVPVIVDFNIGNFVIPENVSFAAGESDATLEITYPVYVVGMNFNIHLPEEYINPYKEKEGSYDFNLTVTKPYKLCDVTYSQASDGVSGRFAGVTGSEIYAYKGLNKFTWINFMGSGIDMPFTVDISNTSGAEFDVNDITKLKGDFVPTDYYYMDSYGYAFVNPGGSENLVTWTPEGSSEEITYFYYYFYQGGHYSYIDFAPAGDSDDENYGYGYFYSPYINSDYENTIYFYLNYVE